MPLWLPFRGALLWLEKRGFLNEPASMYPQSFWLFGFKLKILKHFKQIRSHLKDYIELSSIPSEAVLRMFFCASPPAVAPSLLFCRPELPLFVAPRRKLRGLHVIRHPERSEGCLATLGMFYVRCQGVTFLSTILNGLLLFNTP